LDESEEDQLQTFVEELGIEFFKLFNSTDATYLCSTTNTYYPGFLTTTFDDSDDDEMYWTRSMDGCIENLANGNKKVNF
jgi:hypothetical protein